MIESIMAESVIDVHKHQNSFLQLYIRRGVGGHISYPNCSQLQICLSTVLSLNATTKFEMAMMSKCTLQHKALSKVAHIEMILQVMFEF